MRGRATPGSAFRIKASTLARSRRVLPLERMRVRPQVPRRRSSYDSESSKQRAVRRPLASAVAVVDARALALSWIVPCRRLGRPAETLDRKATLSSPDWHARDEAALDAALYPRTS